MIKERIITRIKNLNKWLIFFIITKEKLLFWFEKNIVFNLFLPTGVVKRDSYYYNISSFIELNN